MNWFILQFFALLHSILPILPVFISSRIYAVLCTLHLGLGINVSGPLETRTINLSLSTRQLETHIVSTKNVATGPNTRTVLVVHGLAATAHNDPRILRLAASIASAQPYASVLVPYLPPLAECDLKDDPVALIEEILRVVSADGDLCPSGRVAIASACISAGMSLAAAARVDEVVPSALCIGSHASALNVVKHCVEREGKDDSRYAINSVLASFLKPSGPLNELLKAYTTDDHHRNVNMPAEDLDRLLKVYPEEAKVFERLHDDVPYLHEVIAQVTEDNKDVFLGMSPTECIDQIKCESIVLVHAATDDVVPSSESLALMDAFKGRDDVQTRLCVTPLLNHGDQRAVGLGDVLEILKLISAFVGFYLPDNKLKCGKSKAS